MKFSFALLLILFASVVIGELTWMIFLYESKVSFENHLQEESQSVNFMMINRIDSYISERTVDMLNLVHDKSVQEAMISSNTEFQKMSDPRGFIEQQNVTWMTVPRATITPFMNNIIENPTSDRLRDMISTEKAIFHNDVFGRLLLANSYGADVAGSIKPDDYDQFTDPWWVKAKQDGQYIGDEQFDKASGTLSIPISIRIDDSGGNFLGVAKGVIVVDTIFKSVQSLMQAGNIHPDSVMLVDADLGSVLYSSESSHASYGSILPASYLKNIQGQSGSFVNNDNDTNGPELVTYTRSSSANISPTFDWVFITEYNRASALKPIVDLSNQMIFVMIAAVPTASVIIVYIASKFGSPIRSITKAAKRFVGGEAVQLIPVGTDEEKELTMAFNTLTQAVLDSRAEISKSEERYKTLFDISPVAIAVTDDRFVITSANKSFLELFGFSKDEIIGRPASVAVSDRSLRTYEEFRVQGDKIVNEMIWSRRKDGQEFPSSVSVQKIFDKDKKLVGVIAVIKDLTDVKESLKRLEEK